MAIYKQNINSQPITYTSPLLEIIKILIESKQQKVYL